MRYLNVTYVRIPWGEIQYGHVSGRITWFRKKPYHVRKARV